MKTVYRVLQEAIAHNLGCGDCTMMAEWRTASVQKPGKCRISESYIFCPVTGEYVYDYEAPCKQAMYLFVDGELEDEVG